MCGGMVEKRRGVIVWRDDGEKERINCVEGGEE